METSPSTHLSSSTYPHPPTQWRQPFTIEIRMFSMCVHAWATQPHTDPLTHTKWSGCQLTKNKITSQLIEIIGFCLKMFDLWRLLHPHWLIWNTQLSAHPAIGDSHLQLKFEYLQMTLSAMMNKTHKQSSWNTIALVYFTLLEAISVKMDTVHMEIGTNISDMESVSDHFISFCKLQVNPFLSVSVSVSVNTPLGYRITRVYA